MVKSSKPTFREERLLWQQGRKFIAGIDEVGRGSFAGPLVAAAVILPETFSASEFIKDSKLLSTSNRNRLSQIIKAEAVCYSLSEVSVNYINKYGIGSANQLAFRKAIKLLSINPDYILIDGFAIKKYSYNKQKAIIGGDKTSITIAAASIIAKVYRDSIMENLSDKFTEFEFANNKGYGTKSHRQAIKKYGLTSLHRTSFKLLKYT